MTEETVDTYTPLFELWVDDSVGESLSADTDTFQYTITLELMQYQSGINETWNKPIVIQ